MVIEYECAGDYSIAKVDGSAEEIAALTLAVQGRHEKIDSPLKPIQKAVLNMLMELDGRSISQSVAEAIRDMREEHED